MMPQLGQRRTFPNRFRVLALFFLVAFAVKAPLQAMLEYFEIHPISVVEHRDGVRLTTAATNDKRHANLFCPCIRTVVD